MATSCSAGGAEFAGLENAGLEFGGLKSRAGKCRTKARTPATSPLFCNHTTL